MTDMLTTQSIFQAELNKKIRLALERTDKDEVIDPPTELDSMINALIRMSKDGDMRATGILLKHACVPVPDNVEKRGFFNAQEMIITVVNPDGSPYEKNYDNDKNTVDNGLELFRGE